MCPFTPAPINNDCYSSWYEFLSISICLSCLPASAIDSSNSCFHSSPITFSVSVTTLMVSSKVLWPPLGHFPQVAFKNVYVCLFSTYTPLISFWTLDFLQCLKRNSVLAAGAATCEDRCQALPDSPVKVMEPSHWIECCHKSCSCSMFIIRLPFML